MIGEGFFAITFVCTSDAISTEKVLKERFKVAMIPTPRDISKSCGFALKFAGTENEKDILECFETLNISAFLYFLGEKDESGKRQARLLISKTA